MEDQHRPIGEVGESPPQPSRSAVTPGRTRGRPADGPAVTGPDARGAMTALQKSLGSFVIAVQRQPRPSGSPRSRSRRERPRPGHDNEGHAQPGPAPDRVTGPDTPASTAPLIKGSAMSRWEAPRDADQGRNIATHDPARLVSSRAR